MSDPARAAPILDHEEALRTIAALRPRAEQGDPDASLTLARIALHPPPTLPRDPHAGRVLLGAARQAHPDAGIVLAALLLTPLGGPVRTELAATILGQALAAGSQAARRVFGCLAVAHEGADAFGDLRDAAAAGDGTAREVLAALPPQPARRARPSGTLARWFAAPAPPVPLVETLGSALDLRCAPTLLAPWQCAYLRATVADEFVPSKVVDPKAGGALAAAVRTSEEAGCQAWRLDPVLLGILQRMAALGRQPLAHGEPLALLRYRPGQEYQDHYDYFTDDETRRAPERHHGGQRHTTVIAYLNQVAEGGATGFPRLGLRVAPRLGSAIAWRNCDAAGGLAPDSLHSGEPVVRGEKWIATLWLRMRPVNYYA